MADAPGELTAGSLLQVFGGVKGLLDSSIPSTVFVVAYFIADLNTSITAAVIAGLLVVALRKSRGESVQQAFSGFFGLVVSVLIVRSTGTGKTFFLPGILITAGSGLAFGISLLLKQPVIAVALSAVDPRYAVWKEHAALRAACTRATVVWMISFFIRAAVATTVALSVGDNAGDNLLILIVINAVKWPLIIGSALYTVALVKAADVPAVVEEP